MVNHRGKFSVELVEQHGRLQCPEDIEPASGQAFARVDPEGDYLVRVQVLNAVDADRKFLFYVHINDLYIGHRQCLSQRDGLVDVGLLNFSDSGVLIGTNEPMRFHEARLLEKGATSINYLSDSASMDDDSNDPSAVPIHTDILHMGKVTVKIYEGVMERRSSAFGNNLCGDEAYQPGLFVQSINLHCATTADLGISYLISEDRERFRKAESKRSFDYDDSPTNHHSNDHRPAFKRIRTESGYVGVMQTSSKHSGGNGMDCAVVMHPAPRFG
ncbi:expressed unknown protein [Seminavis robusta]|uniref:Uncharacterized protein n=1 Tax=Seminavis robusta TaxID=568900 RepID=A0A9N8DSN3_9STRA|nr:expressed unknown protein [Seminavis robusta]|eukprot:Sro324_g117560.1 n/a (272) ;mRNA; f:36539-37354